jgi:hypothetical protein
MASAGPRWAMMPNALRRSAWVLAIVIAACGAPPSEPIVAAQPGNPLVGITPDDREFDGIVRERLPAGTYVYLAVEHDQRLRWVATTGSTAEPGTPVHVQSMGMRHDFHSRRLSRTFDELVFGVVSTVNERNQT